MSNCATSRVQLLTSRLLCPRTTCASHHLSSSLAIGSPLSQLTTLQQKVEAINAKHGPFDACIIVGDLFKADSDGSELSGISREFSVQVCN